MLFSGECNSRESVSSATLTIVVSSTAMISPSVATPATTNVARSSPPESQPPGDDAPVARGVIAS